jgi:N-acetylglucosamine-6-phosphate deacetylase
MEVVGRLVLDDGVALGRVRVEAGTIVDVELESEPTAEGLSAPGTSAGPLIAPGFVDVHVHGWGGHDAMGPTEDLDGMARALFRRGVTSFLPTAVTRPLPELATFAVRVRAWISASPSDGATPLGFNLEGPFVSRDRPGAQNPAFIRAPAEVPWTEVAPLVDGLRVTTVAPEVLGAIELIERLAAAGVAVSLGHSAASRDESLAGYAAGARSTTHLFNAMSGVNHHAPGLAAVALSRDAACVELIADGHHVDPIIWPLILRTKPADRVLLVSDAISLAGTGEGLGQLGGLEVEVRGDRCTLRGTDVLAGSVIALDTAVRNLVAHGVPIARAVAAATRVPLALIGVMDRGRIAPGQRADLVELDDDLVVRRVTHGDRWLDVANPGATAGPRQRSV